MPRDSYNVPEVAKLKRISDGLELTLPAQCLVGRSPSCVLQLDDRYASSEHAKISWTDTRWVLRDLGSRNGTFVGGQRLEAGQSASLAAGTEIGFGQEATTHIVIDATRPGAMAIDLVTNEVHAAVGDLIALPSDATPELSVYAEGKGLGWIVEDAKGGTRPLKDREMVYAGGRAFRIELPVVAEETPLLEVAMTMPNVQFRFAVSLDEERVQLSVVHQGRAHELERREHGYVLLTLARLRQADAKIPPEQRGWRTLEELSSMLRQEINAINVAIHRARQQLAAFGLEGAAGIVESSSGKRRFGSDRFQIVRLEE